MNKDVIQKLEYRGVQQLAKLSAREKHSEIVERPLEIIHPGLVPTSSQDDERHETPHVVEDVQRPSYTTKEQEENRSVSLVSPVSPTFGCEEELVNAIQPQRPRSSVRLLRPADFNFSFQYHDQNRSPSMGSENRLPQAEQRAGLSDKRKILGVATHSNVSASRPRVFFPPTSAELARAKARAKEGVALQPLAGRTWAPVFRPPTPQGRRSEKKDENCPTSDGMDGRKQQSDNIMLRPVIHRPTAGELEADLLILEATSGNRRDILEEIERLRQTLAVVKAKEEWIEEQGRMVRRLRRAIEAHYVDVLEANPHVYGEEVEDSEQR